MRIAPWLLGALLAACGSPEPGEQNSSAHESASEKGAPPVRAEVPQPEGIPAAFHGVYDRSLEACGRPSEYRLIVSADALRFHESLGAVRSVTLESANAVSITAGFEGEGESWTAVQRLALDEAASSLTVTGADHSTTRVRCRGPSASPSGG